MNPELVGKKKGGPDGYGTPGPLLWDADFRSGFSPGDGLDGLVHGEKGLRGQDAPFGTLSSSTSTRNFYDFAIPKLRQEGGPANV